VSITALGGELISEQTSSKQKARELGAFFQIIRIL